MRESAGEGESISLAKEDQGREKELTSLVISIFPGGCSLPNDGWMDECLLVARYQEERGTGAALQHR